jgi:hypothetical protein
MTFCPFGGPLKRESAAIAKARRQVGLPRGGK